MRLGIPTFLTVLAVALTPTLVNAGDKEWRVKWTPTPEEAQAFIDLEKNQCKPGVLNGGFAKSMDAMNTSMSGGVLAGEAEPYIYTPLCYLEELSNTAAESYDTINVLDGSTPIPTGFRVVALPYAETKSKSTWGGKSQNVQTGNVISFKYAVLKSENKKNPTVLKPISIDRELVTFKNLLGYSGEHAGIDALFDPDEVENLRSLHKKGEFYVCLVATTGREVCDKVKSKHFKHLR